MKYFNLNGYYVCVLWESTIIWIYLNRIKFGFRIKINSKNSKHGVEYMSRNVNSLFVSNYRSGGFPQITVRFRVEMDSADLGHCSSFGGCTFTISGEGFTDNMVVTFGDTECDVIPGTVTATEFECYLNSTEKVHRVTNAGRDAGQGKL